MEENIQKKTGIPFHVWFAITFLEENLELIVEQQHWITESPISALLFSILYNVVQLMFSFGPDDYTTLGFRTFIRMLDMMFQLSHEHSVVLMS